MPFTNVAAATRVRLLPRVAWIVLCLHIACGAFAPGPKKGGFLSAFKASRKLTLLEENESPTHDEVEVYSSPSDCAEKGKSLKGGTYCYPKQKFDLAAIEKSKLNSCCRVCPETFEEGLSLLQISAEEKEFARRAFAKMHNRVRKLPKYTNTLGTSGADVESMLPCCAVCPTQFLRPSKLEDVPAISLLETNSRTNSARMTKGGRPQRAASTRSSSSTKKSSASSTSNKGGGSSTKKSGSAGEKKTSDKSGNDSKKKKSDKAGEGAKKKKSEKAGKDAKKKSEKAGNDAKKKSEKAGNDAKKKSEKAGKDAKKKSEKAGKDAKKKSEKAGKDAKKKSEKAGKSSEKQSAKAGKASKKKDKANSKASEKASKASKKAAKKGGDGGPYDTDAPPPPLPVPPPSKRPAIPNEHFEIRSTYEPDKCCYICDAKQMSDDDAGCCPVCPSMFTIMTGGAEPFGGPFFASEDRAHNHVPDEMRPFAEAAGEELGLDASTSLTDPIVREHAEFNLNKAKVKRNRAHNKLQEEHTKKREKQKAEIEKAEKAAAKELTSAVQEV